MSIAQLLSINGARRPRYITVAGRTVFDGVTVTTAGHIHPEHGLVTPVARHTFHDGPGPEDTGTARWWESPEKLGRHVDDMARAFPGFELVPGTDTTPPAFVGDIDTGRGTFTVGVYLRRDQGLPVIAVLSGQRLGRNAGRWPLRSPHLYDSGHLCVADESNWDVRTHTAATATAWAAHWLAAFTEWRMTLKWPIDGYQPDVA